ncbi:MAG: NADH-quinone oxidoreductase subunit K [Verrucomicrobiota bacterium]|nr:NADH-quinone oxidoreductase subunit K [Verrucomicrobiota bacterium]
MQIDTAILIGVMFTCAIYLMLNQSFVKILFGIAILSNAANLLILAMSGCPDNAVEPFINGQGVPMVDPLPQALILTAIVIGFGTIAYMVLLLYRLFLDFKTTSAKDLYHEELDQRK